MAVPNPFLRWFLQRAFEPYHFTPSEEKDKVPPPLVPGSLRYYVHKCLNSPYFGTPKQVHCARLYTQATLSIFGNVFMWVGMWQLVSAPRGLIASPDVIDAICNGGGQHYCFLYNMGTLRNVLYYSLGGILIFCTGTWYGNASLFGTYVPWWISRYPIFIVWQSMYIFHAHVILCRDTLRGCGEGMGMGTGMSHGSDSSLTWQQRWDMSVCFSRGLAYTTRLEIGLR